MCAFKIISILIILTVDWSFCKFFEGYKVIELNLKDETELNFFNTISKSYEVDIWEGPSLNIPTNIMLNPTQFKKFTEELTTAGIKYSIIQSDIDRLISDSENSETLSYSNSFHKRSYDSLMSFPHFPRYGKILRWMKHVSKKYNFVSMIEYGKSYENRDLTVLKISTGPNRKIVLLDAGIHAREWLSITTILYMADKLIKSYTNKESDTITVLSKYDFYLIPVFNPDGYELSHKKKYRLWRKNVHKTFFYRRLCFGVDLNRNFNVDFGGEMSSTDPCSPVYRGSAAFSEAETKAFANFVKHLKKSIAFYTSLHSYSQLWFVPYAFNSSIKPDYDEEVRRVADIGSKALFNVNGLQFQVGTPGQLLYNATGGSYDWMRLVLGVKYSYTLELRPERSNNGQGFIVSVDEIKPAGEEVYAGIIAAINAMKF